MGNEIGTPNQLLDFLIKDGSTVTRYAWTEVYTFVHHGPLKDKMRAESVMVQKNGEIVLRIKLYSPRDDLVAKRELSVDDKMREEFQPDTCRIHVEVRPDFSGGL